MIKREQNGFKDFFFEFINACHFVYKLSPILALVLLFSMNLYLGLTLLFVFGFGLLAKNKKFKESVQNGRQ